MRTWTNMAWPEDPYRTGQQLYPRPGPRLAAFTVQWALRGGRWIPAAVACAYLQLHRTRAVMVTEQTFTFGFRVAAMVGDADIRGVVAVADLDLMQARRHAAIITGRFSPTTCRPCGR